MCWRRGSGTPRAAGRGEGSWAPGGCWKPGPARGHRCQHGDCWGWLADESHPPLHCWEIIRKSPPQRFWLPPAWPGTGRTQQCPRQRRGTGKGDNGVIESPSVPGRQRLARGTGCLARAAWEARNAGLLLRTGWDCVKQWLGGRSGLLIGVCGDTPDPCEWGHPSVAVLGSPKPLCAADSWLPGAAERARRNLRALSRPSFGFSSPGGQSLVSSG